MNTYDDIKRFKEKTHMEGIDYKEISDSGQEGAQQNWPILRQLSAAADAPGALGSSQRTVQPAPVPVSGREFAGQGLLSSLSEQLPPKAPAPAVAAAPDAAAPAAADAARYTSLFRPKPAARPAADSRRDTPLQPLLEMIASCR